METNRWKGSEKTGKGERKKQNKTSKETNKTVVDLPVNLALKSQVGGF